MNLLPSPEQILVGLILAQINQYSSGEFESKEKFHKGHIVQRGNIWKKIFELGSKSLDKKTALTPEILSDPNHEFVKTLMYIYSMQSFLFKELNTASREKNVKLIEFYGPFASALSFAVNSGHHESLQVPEEQNVILYRGMKIKQDELNLKYQKDKLINLQGFTSSTPVREAAVVFCFDFTQIEAENPDKMPLLMEIEVTTKEQFFCLNSKDHSAFPQEEEVLLQDGLQYRVMSLSQIKEKVTHENKEYEKTLHVAKLQMVQNRYQSANSWPGNLQLLFN